MLENSSWPSTPSPFRDIDTEYKEQPAPNGNDLLKDDHIDAQISSQIPISPQPNNVTAESQQQRQESTPRSTPYNPTPTPSPLSPPSQTPSSKTVTSPVPNPMTYQQQRHENSPDAMTQPDDQNSNQKPVSSDQQSQPQNSDHVDPSEPIPDFDWEDLEARFEARMQTCARNEEEIEKEFKDLLSVRLSPV